MLLLSFFLSRRRHTRWPRDWSSDVCSSDLTWFPTTQVPVFTQLATMIGQFGQAVAAVPFLALLVNAGWTAAWGSLAFLLVFSVLLVIAIVQDERSEEHTSELQSRGHLVCRLLLA